MDKRICIEKYSQHNVSMAVGEIGKFWDVGQTIYIKFMDGTPHQQESVKEWCVEWLEYANLQFVFAEPNEYADVRITFDSSDGAWSYVGKDCLNIPADKATMNFGWLDRQVVLHEFGHMLGLGHEHQNPTGGIQWDEQAVIDDLSGPPNYWGYNTIYWNIFRKYSEDQVNSTELDAESIMMYRIPNSWTIGDFSTSFNDDLSAVDKQFISEVYPFEEEPIDEEEVMVEAFRYVFSKKSELTDLDEGPIVRIGRLIGAKTHVKLLKADNVKRVNDILKLGHLDTDDGNTEPNSH